MGSHSSLSGSMPSSSSVALTGLRLIQRKTKNLKGCPRGHATKLWGSIARVCLQQAFGKNRNVRPSGKGGRSPCRVARYVAAISSSARSFLLQPRQGNNRIKRGTNSVPRGAALVARRGMAFPQGEYEENAIHSAPFSTRKQAPHESRTHRVFREKSAAENFCEVCSRATARAVRARARPYNWK
jgi:hypothetical protein